MFNRRMLVALAACLAISASTAMAGGKGGQKIIVVNATTEPAYAFVGPSTGEINAAFAGVENASQFIAAVNSLGGKPVGARGGKATFPKDAGPHVVTIIPADGTLRANQENVVLAKNKDLTVTFNQFIDVDAPAAN